MEVVEEPRYTREYLEADKRSIANAVQVFFSDGTSTDQVAVEYPIGHRRRREEGMPKLEAKFAANLATRFPKPQCDSILQLFKDLGSLEEVSVMDFVAEFTI
jgi:2-methylcitrate dehydratase